MQSVRVHPSLRACLGWAFTIAGTVLALLLTIEAAKGRLTWDKAQLAIGTICVIGGGLGLFLYGAGWAFAATINDEGFRGATLWGRRKTIRWNDIGSVRQVTVKGIPYLLIRSRSSKKEIWFCILGFDKSILLDRLQAFVESDADGWKILLKARTLAFLLALVSVAVARADDSPTPVVPQTVVIPNGKLRLKAFLWKPSGPGPFPAVLFCHGSGGPDADHTGGLPMPEAAEKLALLFLKHGYAFLYPLRRGQGLSADQGPFIQDILKREEAAKGKDARQHLQFVLATTDHLDDVMAGLSFLKATPAIDAKRIAITGHSFGGQLTLLAAERDNAIRAAVMFAAAANSWEQAPELRDRLLAAADKAAAPIMLIQAVNDYSTAPGYALADELERLHKPHLLKIYPPFGRTSDDAHNFLYFAISQWEDDVFKFLDEHVKR